MSRKAKDARPLNVNIERDIHERLERFCEQYGQSKTTAVERAIALYVAKMEEAGHVG